MKKGGHEDIWLSADVGRRIVILDIRLEIALHKQIQFVWRITVGVRPIMAVMLLVQTKLQDGKFECFCEV